MHTITLMHTVRGRLQRKLFYTKIYPTKYFQRENFAIYGTCHNSVSITIRCSTIFTLVVTELSAVMLHCKSYGQDWVVLIRDIHRICSARMTNRHPDVASSPGHSHLFNVTRRKGRRPGIRNHVSEPSVEGWWKGEKSCVGTVMIYVVYCPHIRLPVPY